MTTLPEERRGYLGGSDSAASLGLSGWQSALELYQEKVGLAPPAMDSERFLWGRLLEPVIRQRYADLTGRTVSVPKALLRHTQHPWMVAHPDGYTDDGRVFEAKTASRADEWGEPGSDQVPMAYLIQVQHYMGVMGLNLADLAVLFNTARMEVYEIPFDAELYATIVEGELAFWNCVQTQSPPEPDWASGRVLEVVRKLFPGTTGERVFAGENEESYLATYRDAVVRRDRYADVVTNSKAHLAYFMGEAAELAFQDGSVFRRKLVNRKGYEVAPTEYMDLRLIKPKGKP